MLFSKVFSFLKGNKLPLTVGFVLSIGVFSPYIFGPDNLVEELAELFVHKKTGIDIDLTPDSEEKTNKDFQKILEMSNKYGGHK